MYRITDNIYGQDYTENIMPGVRFPVRTTFLELEGGGVLVISPGPLDGAEVRGYLGGFGQVLCMAPNAFHHRHLAAFHAQFPHVPIHGPEGVKKKAPGVASALLPPEALQPLVGDQVRLFPIAGIPKMEETVLYCARTQTLVVTDLLFHMRAPMPLGRRLVLGMGGAYNRIAQSRLVRGLIKDRAAYLQSVRPLAGLEIRRIIVAHGDIIEGEVGVRQALVAIGAV